MALAISVAAPANAGGEARAVRALRPLCPLPLDPLAAAMAGVGEASLAARAAGLAPVHIGPPGSLGHVLDYRMNGPIAFASGVARMTEELPGDPGLVNVDVLPPWMPANTQRRIVVIVDPHLGKDVLLNQDIQRSPKYPGIDTIGEVLLTLDGARHRQLRKAIQPLFHRKRIEALSQSVNEEVDAMAERWDRHAAEGTPVDLYPQMRALALDVVTRGLFDIKLSPEDKTRLFHADDVAIVYSIKRGFNKLPPRFLYWEYNQAKATLDEIAGHIVDTSQSEFMQGLRAIRIDEEPLSRRELMDFVLEMIIAGHETTSSGLTFSTHLLATHPHAQHRLQSELDTRFQPDAPDVQGLAPLAYTRAVTQEALRLFPPAVHAPRTAVDDVTIGGHPVPAGTHVELVPYVSGLDRVSWTSVLVPCGTWRSHRCRSEAEGDSRRSSKPTPYV